MLFHRHHQVYLIDFFNYKPPEELRVDTPSCVRLRYHAGATSKARASAPRAASQTYMLRAADATACASSTTPPF